MALYSVKTKQPSITTLKVVPLTTVIRAVSINHHRTNLDDNQRAEGAASWLDGDVIVLPDITLACNAFGTTYPAVVRSRGRRGNRPKPTIWLKLLLRSWLCTGEAERVIFANMHEPSIWRALESVTDIQRD